MSGLNAAYEPVIDLRYHQTVGFSAVVSSDGQPPWARQACAFQDMLDADLPGSLSLVVPLDPESLGAACPTELAEVVARAESGLRVFIEIDDRALASDPAAVLRAVDRARTVRWGVTIADVGTQRTALAALPMVAPDMVALHLRHLSDAGEQAAARLVTTVLRHVEASGASLLVRDIETDAHARLARALGASHGQGSFFAAPAPLPDECPVPRAVIPLIGTPALAGDSVGPGDILADATTAPMGEMEYGRLVSLLAGRAATAAGRPLVLASLGRVARERADALLQLGERFGVVLFGPDLAPEPAPGVRGVRLPSTDPRSRDELVVILTEESTTALVAHRPPGRPGLVQVALTHHEATVAGLARTVVRRIPPRGPNNRALPDPVAAPPAQTEETLAVAAPRRAWAIPWRSWRFRRG